MSKSKIKYTKPQAKTYYYMPCALKEYSSTSLRSDNGRYSITCTITHDKKHPHATGAARMLIETHDHRNRRTDQKWLMHTLYDGVPTRDAYNEHYTQNTKRENDWNEAREYARTAFTLTPYSQEMQERFNRYNVDPANKKTYITWVDWSFRSGDEETIYEGFGSMHHRHYGQGGTHNDLDEETQEDFNAMTAFIVNDDMPTVHGDSESGYRVTYQDMRHDNVHALSFKNPNAAI